MLAVGGHLCEKLCGDLRVLMSNFMILGTQLRHRRSQWARIWTHPMLLS